MPDRLSDQQLEIVSAIAKAPVPALAKANANQFADFMRKISTLPRKADDDGTAEERVKIYSRMLDGLSADEFGYLARTAIATCRWMPTVAECLDILKGWRRNDELMQARHLASTMSQRELQARFDGLCQTVGKMPVADIDALPGRIKTALENRCLLWRLPSGRFVPRPCRAIKAMAA